MSAAHITLTLLFGLATGAVWADCPPTPPDFALPTAERQPVDLEQALDAPWQAGGEIVLTCAPDGTPRAGRLSRPPRDAAEEQARRAEHFALARKVNMAGNGEAHPLGLSLAAEPMALLERFALSDAGAVWLRAVADDTLRLFNQGYLEYDRAAWSQAVVRGALPRLSELLIGRLTEAAKFAGDVQPFKFSGYAGPGAMAHPGAIGLGDKGMRCSFPTSDELVDPYAIISHEFGHTRYGDPASAGTLLGEARTVERYENPVRVRNGYEPRAVYFERLNQGPLEARKDSLVQRLMGLERERGIAVKEQSPVDKYYCDCPGPLPIILDCVVRPQVGPQDASAPAAEWDCNLNWKHDSFKGTLPSLLRPPGQ